MTLTRRSGSETPSHPHRVLQTAAAVGEGIWDYGDVSGVVQIWWKGAAAAGRLMMTRGEPGDSAFMKATATARSRSPTNHVAIHGDLVRHAVRRHGGVETASSHGTLHVACPQACNVREALPCPHNNLGTVNTAPEYMSVPVPEPGNTFSPFANHLMGARMQKRT